MGVVATTQQLATARGQLEPVLPGVKLVRYRTEQAARSAITGQRTYGALIFAGGREQVLTAAAASFTVSSLLQAAEQRGVREVEPVVPLASGDPRGLALNLLLVPLMVTGLLGGQLAVTLVGRVGLRRRALAIAGMALVGGVAVAALIGPVMGTLPGPLLPEAGVIAPHRRDHICGRGVGGPMDWTGASQSDHRGVQARDLPVVSLQVVDVRGGRKRGSAVARSRRGAP